MELSEAKAAGHLKEISRIKTQKRVIHLKTRKEVEQFLGQANTVTSLK
ncbi:hypothetical protein [Litoribacterium kuwaitense]|nr:hypothetical protein [Litoribacterium kuwaitense]